MYVCVCVCVCVCMIYITYSFNHAPTHMMQDDATSGSLSRRMEVSLSATLYLSTPVIMWDVGGRLPQLDI